ncbi:MAG: DUF3696 domain-containing protein [Bacteroidales bacterium]|nr:DUF3696 domain-containing protein [Bacteroidales bacterium]
MNTKLTIKNFRVFDEDGVTVDLKPITVLTGCNSSGKSSVVKAALMLNEFWKQQKEKINTYKVKIDFTTYPNNQLGRFDRVLHDGAKSKVMCMEYTVYSLYLSQEVTVKLQFVSIDKDALNNAYLQNVEITTERGVVFSIKHNLDNIRFQGLTLGDFQNGHFETNYNLIKEELLDFLIIGRLVEKLRNLAQSHDEQWCYPEKPISDEEFYEKKSKIVQYKTRCEDSKRQSDIAECYSYKYTEISNSNGITIAEKSQETGSLYYIPILDNFDKMGKEDVCLCIETKLQKDTDYINRLKKVIDGFKKSKYTVFSQFFKTIDFDHNDGKSESIGFFIPSEEEFNSKISIDEALKNLDSMDKEEICSRIANKDDENFIVNGQKIVDEFRKSEFNTFSHFFKYYENEYISSKKNINPGRESMFKNAGFFPEMYSVVMNWNHLVYPEENKFYSSNDEFVYHGGPVYYEHTIERLFSQFAQDIIKECLSPAFSSISYVSSSRATIKRLYTLETKDDFSVLLKKCLENGNIKPETSFINKWVKKFGIGDSITFHADSEGLGVQIRLHKTPEDKDGRLLADEGYGITQLLSIMLQIEMSGKSETTIAVEEPEIHLHPKYQSLLADMFVDAYKTLGQHFIIETHSEYLIRRLQLLVAGIDTEKKLDKNDVSIAYIYTKEEAEKENQPRVKNIAICEDGYLDDTFGSGFFDEATKLSRKLM